MRSITPIVATVILLLMAVAAAGMAFLTITSYQSQATTSAQGGLQALTSRTKAQLKIESVSEGKIYLRNLGAETFSDATFFVNGRPLNVSGSDTCETGNVCVYTILENVTCEGECILSMGTDMPIGTEVRASEQELGTEESGGPAIVDTQGPVMGDFYLFPVDYGIYGIYRCDYNIPSSIPFNATVDDSLTGGSIIQSCEFQNADDPTWHPMLASDGAFDSAVEAVNGTLEIPNECVYFNVFIRCTDAQNNQNETIVLDPTCSLDHTYGPRC